MAAEIAKILRGVAAQQFEVDDDARLFRCFIVLMVFFLFRNGLSACVMSC